MKRVLLKSFIHSLMFHTLCVVQKMHKIHSEGVVKMDNSELSTCGQNDTPGDSGHNPLEESTLYNVGGMTFIVEPHYRESGTETISDILIRLMKTEN